MANKVDDVEGLIRMFHSEQGRRGAEDFIDNLANQHYLKSKAEQEGKPFLRQVYDNTLTYLKKLVNYKN